MELYSSLIGKKVAIDGYQDVGGNTLLKRRGLKEVADTLPLKVKYKVISNDPAHSVVLCKMKYKDGNKVCKSSAIGEVVAPKDIYEKYPTTTAFNMAYDRALVSLLGLPSCTYSTLEFYSEENKDLMTASNTENALADNPEPTSEQERPAQVQDEKPKPAVIPVKDFVLNFGTFVGKGLTVEQVFTQAAYDKAMASSIRVYLAEEIPPKEKDNADKRYGLIALKKYAKEYEGGVGNGEAGKANAL